jgi:hypothetical protein
MWESTSTWFLLLLRRRRWALLSRTALGLEARMRVSCLPSMNEWSSHFLFALACTTTVQCHQHFLRSLFTCFRIWSAPFIVCRCRQVSRSLDCGSFLPHRRHESVRHLVEISFSLDQTNTTSSQQMVYWPNGKASDYESGDCRFDPCIDHTLLLYHAYLGRLRCRYYLSPHQLGTPTTYVPIRLISKGYD